MRIGISCYDLAVDSIVELAITAEQLGFADLWLGEHVVAPVAYASTHPADPGSESGSDHNGKPIVDPSVRLADPLIALASVAARTATLQLATGIYLLPLRHPLVTARAVATLAQVSGGRFSLGVGAGWLREEFEALDVPFPGRTARLEEQIAVLRAALAGGPFSFEGEHYSIPAVQVSPVPCDVPLILGGNSEPALRRAVRLADGWFSSGIPTLEQALRLRDRLDAVCVDLGRDRPLQTTWRVAGPEPDLLEQYAAEGFEHLALMAYDVWVGGDPDERRAHLATVAERLGLTEPAGVSR